MFPPTPPSRLAGGILGAVRNASWRCRSRRRSDWRSYCKGNAPTKIGWFGGGRARGCGELIPSLLQAGDRWPCPNFVARESGGRPGSRPRSRLPLPTKRRPSTPPTRTGLWSKLPPDFPSERPPTRRRLERIGHPGGLRRDLPGKRPPIRRPPGLVPPAAYRFPRRLRNAVVAGRVPRACHHKVPAPARPLRPHQFLALSIRGAGNRNGLCPAALAPGGITCPRNRRARSTRTTNFVHNACAIWWGNAMPVRGWRLR